ncbi:MAG: aminotransferase class V-fold PLP-dependent enzyme [Saprospiraceae bacterium]
MQDYFQKFRKNIIGNDVQIQTPYHASQPVVYADWTASGRCYKTIEEKLMRDVFPMVANTHTETNSTGMSMTLAYHKALHIIKEHVNAGPDDVILSTGSGMTGVVNKLQRILGFKIHEKFKAFVPIAEDARPIVFVSHMEHHSNQTTWLETIADVEIIHPDAQGYVSLEHFQGLLEKYAHREVKIAAITSCSNVTGVFTPYFEIAEMIHKAGGYCFVDFACSAPYIDINMHPSNPLQYLDAIYFSPHKFLGGPGSSGIIVFNKKLYNNRVPDTPGGGTVEWTNPWRGRSYISDIEQREDGGTPAFLQTIKVALSVRLKEEMGVENILKREKQQNAIIWRKLGEIPNIHILADNIKDRLSVFSFYIEDLHYNLAVKILNDRFGIQVRGGCSCAGTYGHYLLNIKRERSKGITDMIDSGDNTYKPGWIRMSLHPTMPDDEIVYIADAIIALAENHENWAKDYISNKAKNIFTHKNNDSNEQLLCQVEEWFDLQEPVHAH